MTVKMLLVVVLCAVLGGAIAEGAVHEVNSMHFEEHAGNFKRHPVHGHKNALVLFYKDNEDCKALAPEYELFAATMPANASTSVMVAQANATLETDLVKNFNVKEFPWLVWLTQGNQNWTLANWGGRDSTAEEMLAFIGKKLGWKSAFLKSVQTEAKHLRSAAARKSAKREL